MNYKNTLALALMSAIALTGTIFQIDAAGKFIKYVTDASIDSQMMRGKVILDFYAEWCSPCKTLTPRLQRVAGNHPEITVIKVDIDQYPSISDRYQVRSVPTLVFLQDGNIKGRVTGTQSEGQLENLIKQYLF